MIEYFQSERIGKSKIKLKTNLTMDESEQIAGQMGLVFRLVRLDWKDDGTAEIVFEPGNGMIKMETDGKLYAPANATAG